MAKESPMFNALLFGDFKESNCQIVEARYSGTVLCCLLDYCKSKNFEPVKDLLYYDFASFVELADASDYYLIPCLFEQMKTYIVEIISKCVPKYTEIK